MRCNVRHVAECTSTTRSGGSPPPTDADRTLCGTPASSATRRAIDTSASLAEPIEIVDVCTSMPLATRPASTNRLSLPPLKASRTGASDVRSGANEATNASCKRSMDCFVAGRCPAIIPASRSCTSTRPSSTINVVAGANDTTPGNGVRRVAMKPLFTMLHAATGSNGDSATPSSRATGTAHDDTTTRSSVPPKYSGSPPDGDVAAANRVLAGSTTTTEQRPGTAAIESANRGAAQTVNRCCSCPTNVHAC